MKHEEDDILAKSLYGDLYDFKSEGEEEISRKAASNGPVAGSSTIKAEEQPKDDKPRLIWSLREAAAEAMRTFISLEECTYQNKTLGLSRQLEESMVCDCSWDPAIPEEACGANCINRLTQVECTKGDCRCRSHCRNQRFQRKQYAPLEIVLTEKKGYGVRASQDLEADAFIYEYIGEVIAHNSFLRRIKEYGDEGIEHFYFMQLQKEEYIDATRKGGIGRFLNHSCRPNCYVAKWVVGKKMRMGIFAKREILAGEELTFNYNVDRYGHEAQECYCGESNCVGFIGGKTQTDIGAMDDLYLEALGILDDVEAFGLKGSKKRKGKKLDEDYIPDLKAIQLHEAPKVMSAIRQAASVKRILTKLLTRVQLTTEPIVQRQLLRLHGINMMGTLLNEHESDIEVVGPVLEILLGWPLMTRNKLVSSKIEPLIEKLTLSEDEALAVRAQELVKVWATLELGYRIPKAVQDAVDAIDASIGDKRKNDELFESLAFKRARMDDDEVIDVDSSPRFQAAAATVVEDAKRDLPRGWKQQKTEAGITYYYLDSTKQMSWVFPTDEVVAKLDAEWNAQQAAKQAALDVDDILGRARLEAEERERLRLANEAAEAEERARQKAAKVERAKRQHEARKKVNTKKDKKKPKQKASSSQTASRDAVQDKEKAVLRAFGGVVVNTMSRYKSQLDVAQFKRRAKEITHLLVEKEKKSSSFDKESYVNLSKDKTAKVRKFVDEYVQKILARKSSGSSKPTTPSKILTNGTASGPCSPVVGLPQAIDADVDAVDERAMVRELAGDVDPEHEHGAGSEDEDDGSSMQESDEEAADRDSPGTTPSSAAQQPTDEKIAPIPLGQNASAAQAHISSTTVVHA